MPVSRVLVVDDHALFRQGVRITLQEAVEIEVVGEAENGTQAVEMAQELRPDLVLMDISMPGGGGLIALGAIKRCLPETQVIMLTVHDQDENLFEAIRLGARGFLSKDVRAPALLASIRRVIDGEAALSQVMENKLLDEFSRLSKQFPAMQACSLTSREKQVLQKVYDGLTNREIAAALCISENTVKVHMNNILKKLHLDNRYQAAEVARGWGWWQE